MFGVTVYAASTVLASFMAGLAMGSLAGGGLAKRVRHPLLWFAGAAFLVGALAASYQAGWRSDPAALLEERFFGPHRACATSSVTSSS